MMWVSVSILTVLCNPLENPPWEEVSKGITHQEIKSAIERGQLQQLPPYSPFTGETRQQHINRIAWYVVHGWADSPITIDLTSLDLVIIWPILDGNHRLAAAIYRGDDMIWADVFGSQKQIKEYLYEKVEEKQEQASQSAGASDDSGSEGWSDERQEAQANQSS